MKTFFVILFMWPFILIGLINSYIAYKKSRSELTYKQWLDSSVERWVADGKPRGKGSKYYA